ncbi:MAG TPA: DUF3943 domain-containing protein [Anaeromyxobacteraceae bacterium]|nr:DUF3943 domain-containing protein [Anaeromyxobacteraceae bacterium]
MTDRILGRPLLLAALAMASASMPRLASAQAEPPLTPPSLQDGSSKAPPPDLKLRPPELAPAKYQQSYLIPVLEVGVLYFIWNAWGRWVLQEDFANVTWASINRNLTGGVWWWDEDAMAVNQIGHPLQGSMNYLAARSTGNNLWVSFGYSFGASLLWEIAGETEPPSYNDMITTPVGGTVLGEILYRSHALIIQSMSPGALREVLAFIVAPTAGLNRAMFGNRYVSPEFYETRSIYAQLGVGGGTAYTTVGNGSWKGGGSVQFMLTYGIVGDPDLELRRPFDHFVARAGIVAGTGVAADITTRGTLAAAKFGGTGDWRGLWGLYALYDYISPEVMRASAVALGFGGDGQWIVAPGAVLEVAGIVGPAFGADGMTAQPQGFRDQHMGPGAMGVVEARGIFADRVRAMLEWRQYFIGTAVDHSGWDDMSYAVAGLAFRLAGPHGIGISSTLSRRHAQYTGQPDTFQQARSLVVYYELLGSGLGAPPRRIVDDAS